MKISIACLALLGLSCAELTIVGRAPQSPPYKETSPSEQIADQTVKGMKGWFGGLTPPPGGSKPPIKGMVGSVPNSPRPESKSESHRLNKDGGNVQGNIKKPNNSWSKNKLCRKRDGRCNYKSRNIRLKSGARSGGAVAFMQLAPYARNALEEVKQWDNPIGRGVKWFDDAMTNIQQAIGGEQVPEIYGNELKLKFICWVRGEQKYPNDVDKACERQRDQSQGKQRPPEPAPEWLTGLNQLLEVCYKLETDSPEDENLRIKLQGSCTELESEVHRVEHPVVITEGIPKITDVSGKCKCDAYNLPPITDSCHNTCLASYALGGWSLDLTKEKKKVAENPVVVEEIPEKIEKIPDEDLEKANPLAELSLKQKDQLGRYGDVVVEVKNETSNAHTCYDNYRSNSDKAIAISIEDCDKQYFKVQSLLRKAREIREEPDFPPGLWIFELPDIKDGRTSLQGDATKELQDILQGLTKVADQASIFQKQAERLLSDKSASVD
ncbi:hypothetical protein MAA_11461 [Metarhizium robertsii ARSEF 23]|uniref:Heat-labile enterotoxin IIA, A chain n=1 Tax=Metarhizium robertsii (strain ARSEF 23 / ATCC MYA-3075) TaxID=655844 RepID=A0A0B2XFX8_METRA|nr:uncharacterized protein MAA_11461 [Metarhizium robertsii ARSEF 23]KHO10924.1 hypothetical protein MAA_11461 [Metarhizium robertsii ARSEF 23]